MCQFDVGTADLTGGKRTVNTPLSICPCNTSTEEYACGLGSTADATGENCIVYSVIKIIATIAIAKDTTALGAVGNDVCLDTASVYSPSLSYTNQTGTVFAATHRTLYPKVLNRPLYTLIIFSNTFINYTERCCSFVAGVVDVDIDGVVVAIELIYERMIFGTYAARDGCVIANIISKIDGTIILFTLLIPQPLLIMVARSFQSSTERMKLCE